MRKLAITLAIIMCIIPLSACSPAIENTSTQQQATKQVEKPAEAVIPDEMPTDFQFSVSYGVGAKNKIDTFHKTVTKDLVTAGEAKLENFSFTEAELKAIYQKMKEVEVLQTKELFVETDCHSTPFHTYQLTVQIAGKQNEYAWSDENCELTPQAQELVSLVEFIVSLLEKKPDYQQLPEPSGGYV